MSRLKQGDNRIEWIDCLKFIAVVAVFMDHTWGFLYNSTTFQRTSFFAVSLFVLLGGITAYDSNHRHKTEKWGEDILRKSIHLFVPYAAFLRT